MTQSTGDILHWDGQSDSFQGQYRLVEDLGNGVWRAEHLEPSDELIETARRYYLESEHPYLGYVDPFGPGRRQATRQEALDEEIMRRIERAGQTFELKFISSARYLAAF